jgi:hypothetical protein
MSGVFACPQHCWRTAIVQSLGGCGFDEAFGFSLRRVLLLNKWNFQKTCKDISHQDVYVNTLVKNSTCTTTVSQGNIFSNPAHSNLRWT